MTRDDVKIGLQAVLDFIIVAGSTLGGAMLQSGEAVIPGGAVQLLAVIMGAAAAARRVQAMLEGSPKEALTDTVKQLVAQMRTVQVLAAEALPDLPPAPPGPRTLAQVQEKALAQAALDAKLKAAAAVTPLRVPDAPPVAAVPKNSA